MPPPPNAAVAGMVDLDHWRPGVDLERLVNHVGGAIRASVAAEGGLKSTIRGEVLGKLRTFPDAPAAAGVYRFTDEQVRAARRRRLMTGDVAACAGRAAGHDGLTASVVAVGVCLVRYDGRVNSWRNTFFRHDYELPTSDPVGRLKQVLARRRPTDPDDPSDRADFPKLLRRAVLSVAERRALLKTDARWRLGTGLPAPLEILTGGGSADLIDVALPVLDDLLLKHKRWVYFPTGTANPLLLTLANALEPLEIAVLQDGKAALDNILSTAHVPPGKHPDVDRFAQVLGPNTVVGGYRAGPHAPPGLFVAHADFAVEAGLIAVADGGLSPHRGSPVLLDLARLGADTGLGLDAFAPVVEAAYARARAGHLFAAGRVA